MPVYATLPLILIGGFFAGVALYWIAVHRMVGRPPLMSLLSTFSVNLVLIGLGTRCGERASFNVAGFAARHKLGRYTFPGTHLMAAVLTAALAGSLYLFLYRRADRQGGARGGRQPRSRRAGGHSDDARAGARLRRSAWRLPASRAC